MLMSEKMQHTLSGLVGECFAMNRFLDRCMSLLDTKFKLKRCAKFLHPALAHAFTGDDFADGISTYMGQRDTLVVYPATPIGDEDFNTPQEIFAAFYLKMIEFQSMVYDAMEDAEEEQDHTTKVFLDGFMMTVMKYIDQAQTLVDISNAYGNTPLGLQLMDSNIKKYITV